MCKYPIIFKEMINIYDQMTKRRGFYTSEDLKRFVMDYAWQIHKYKNVPLRDAIKDGWDCVKSTFKDYEHIIKRKRIRIEPDKEFFKRLIKR